MNAIAPPSRVTRPLLFALAAVSASVTAHQIGLMQVLGWMHWHHFAYMIVAVALLGFGVAGTVLSLARERLLAHADALLPWLLLGAAITMPLGVRLAQLEQFAVDLPLVFFTPGSAWRLGVLCLLLVPPFFCGGLATGLLITVNAAQAGRVYAASLAGAGAGGLAGLLAASQIVPPRLPTAAAALALIAALGLWRELEARARLAAVATLALLAAAWVLPGRLASSEFKPLQRVLDLPEARITADRPSLEGWIQVVSSDYLRPAPSLSFDYAGDIPAQPAVFVNGIPYGSLPGRADARSAAWLDYTTDAAAFAAGRPAHVLLLENGPGGWAGLALHRGARRIEVVEPNGALVKLLTHGDAPLAPEWRQPEVTVSVAGARAFLARGDRAFDVIRFPPVGALGGTAGLNAAGEQFLLTREAFIEAWRRLSPEGVIAVTAWMDFPERNPLRLLATLAEAAERVGAPPRAHLAAVRGWATITFLLRRSPWDDGASAALRTFCRERGFDPLILPGLTAEEQQANHLWQNPGFFDLVAALLGERREQLVREYPFVIRAATDQQPYFSQFLRLTQVTRLREVFGARAMPFFELGSMVVAVTFGLLTVLGFACILLPLAKLGWRAPGKAGVLLYYGALGAGFMLVEIGAMLQAHAWLGTPVAGAAVAITTLLLASGVGSRLSERLPADRRTQRRALLAIAALVLIAGGLLAGLGGAARGWPAPITIALLVGIVALPGVAMGMAFPLGVRRLSAARPEHVPWAWAINGSVSVATPAGATLLAMGAGFGALFLAAAVVYAIGWLASEND